MKQVAIYKQAGIHKKSNKRLLERRIWFFQRARAVMVINHSCLKNLQQCRRHRDAHENQGKALPPRPERTSRIISRADVTSLRTLHETLHTRTQAKVKTGA